MDALYKQICLLIALHRVPSCCARGLEKDQNLLEVTGKAQPPVVLVLKPITETNTMLLILLNC